MKTKYKILSVLLSTGFSASLIGDGNSFPTPSGNVGIDQDSPQRTLHVGDESTDYSAFARFDGMWSTDHKNHARIEFNDHNFGIGAGRFNSSGNDDDLYLWSYGGSGRDIRFMSTLNGDSAVSGWNTNMIVKGDSGNIGIGTDSPDPAHKLSVNGSVRAKEVVVDTGWSDFVFEDSYRLRSLEEVEAHIEEYGHLPDVPSAPVVVSEGLSVGEAQKIMMQKIEELTLYMIEKDKQVSDLQAKLAVQQERLNQQEALLKGYSSSGYSQQ